MSETDTTEAKVGRPSAYEGEYARQAYELCLLGAIDEDLARFFGVSTTTIDNWKNAHPEFLGALKDGKEVADAKVAESLYGRATGWEHDAVKIFANTKTGETFVVPYIERYPPDTTAAIFWLKNRRPDLWRDKQHVEHGGDVNLSGVLRIGPAVESPEDWERLAKTQQADLVESKAKLSLSPPDEATPPPDAA